MTNVRRIADQEIEGRYRLCLRKILQVKRQSMVCPKVSGGTAVMRVNFEAKRLWNSFLWENLEQRRVEGSGAESGIKKANAGVGWQKFVCVPQYIVCQICRRSELPKSVSLSLGFLLIKPK